MRRYTIVIEVDDEQFEWMQEATKERRDAVRNRSTVSLQTNGPWAFDLVEGSLVDFRPSRSKVDNRKTNERFKSGQD